MMMAQHGNAFCITGHLWGESTGLCLNIKTIFLRYGISMLKVRRSRDRLIFNMGIPILVRRHLYIETASWFPSQGASNMESVSMSWHHHVITSFRGQLYGNAFLIAGYLWESPLSQRASNAENISMSMWLGNLFSNFCILSLFSNINHS